VQQDFTGTPKPGKVLFHGLPPALAPLTAVSHWVVWRWTHFKGKLTKVPYQARRPQVKASSTDPSTWADYDTAVKANRDLDGIGFCLLDTEFAAFDLDDCRDPATGAIAPWAQDLVDRCASYTEVTISGTGLRIIGRALGPKIHRKQTIETGGSLETYRRAERYIVMTGNALNTFGLENIDNMIDETVAGLDGNKKKAKANDGPRREAKGLPRDLATLLYIPDEGAGVPTAGYSSRSDLLFAFINRALRAGVADEVIIGACLDTQYASKAIYEHVQDNGGNEEYIRKQIEHALNQGPTSENPRRIIRVKEGKLDEDWRQTEAALVAARCPIYVRKNALYQPLWRWEKTNDGTQRQFLTAQFAKLNVPRLSDIVAHHAVQFQRWDKRERKFKNIDPPAKLIERLIEIGHWGFRTVTGIINSPTMRPDGSLLTEQGYDPTTQLWFKSSSDIELPPIPQRPTKLDAESALAKLNELLDGFPFDGETSNHTKSVARSVALAGIMTTILRGAFPAVPLFAVVANEPRSGKTYLGNL
jgi:hypothetical protein